MSFACYINIALQNTIAYENFLFAEQLHTPRAAAVQIWQTTPSTT